MVHKVVNVILDSKKLVNTRLIDCKEVSCRKILRENTMQKNIANGIAFMSEE